MINRNCDICGGYIHEMGSSPFCEHCGKTMCRACEKKHDKGLCKISNKI